LEKIIKILVVSQHFYPENFKINDFCSELIKKGNDITILTGKPNYPTGKFYKGYSLFSKHKELFNGAKIIRVPVLARGDGSSFKLFLNYLSFAFFGSLFTLFHRKKYDFSFVFAVSPITAAIPAIISRIFYGNKLVLWVLDLWPESLYVNDRLKNSTLRKILLSLVRFTYKHSDMIFISSQTMKKSILDKLKPEYAKEIYHMPNWAEETFFEEIIDTNKYLPLMPNGFKIMFAGNIGSGQDIPSLLNAASILKKTSNVKFIIIGDGSLREYLINQIRELKLNETVYYLGSFPLKEMKNLYYHADAMMLSLKDDLLFSYTVPGKLQGYLASKKVVAAMANGESNEIIKQSSSGIAVNSGNYTAFADELLILSKLTASSLEKKKKSGFNYYQKHFKKETIINSFLEKVSNL
jgi:glycosyltransferase involved in cell wall biosynthesis